MKPLYLFFSTGVVIISLVSAVAFSKQKNELPEKRLEIVLRDVGHQLLLQAGDSTSRVLPVKKMNDNMYQLSFQHNFIFIPDTLINVVSRQFKKYQLPKEYRLSVKDCQQQETVFAYEINAKTGNLIPCTGREQETGCYLVQVEFLKAATFNYAWLLLLLIPLCYIGFYWQGRAEKKKEKDEQEEQEENEEVADSTEYIKLGRYSFYAGRQILQLEDTTIPLSEKETKSLKIFAEHPHQVIEREKLIKEIWEEEGIVVISRNVDVLVSKLRKKLSEDSSIKIINVHGRGYKLVI